MTKSRIGPRASTIPYFDIADIFVHKKEHCLMFLQVRNMKYGTQWAGRRTFGNLATFEICIMKVMH